MQLRVGEGKEGINEFFRVDAAFGRFSYARREVGAEEREKKQKRLNTDSDPGDDEESRVQRCFQRSALTDGKMEVS